MNLNLKWLQPGESVDDFALCFGFDVTQGAFGLFADPERNMEVTWLKASDKVESTHNLVITGVGPARCNPDFTRWEKGDLADGTARHVYPLLNHPSLPFRAGLTLHATKGTWSSLPHEFEREEILLPRPMPFYEKFAYVTEEPGGQGIQLRTGHLFGKDDEMGAGEYINWVNDKVVIRDRDIVEIPLGSHPVTALGGTKLGYFWVYWSSGPTAHLTMSSREKFTKDKAL